MSKLCERRIWQYYQEKWIDFATGRENGMRKRVFINIIYGIGIGLFLSFFSETILENILIGPGWSKESDFFDLYGMICWLLLYSPIWGINFIFLEEDLNLSNIVIARYGNIKKWWRGCIIRCAVENVCCYVVLYSILVGTMGGFGEWCHAYIVIITHGLVIFSIGIWIRILTQRMVISAIILTALEACSKLLIVWNIISPKWSIFSWGMYCYSSSNYGEKGVHFPLILIGEIVVFVSCFMIPKTSMKKSLLERINTKNGYTY